MANKISNETIVDLNGLDVYQVAFQDTVKYPETKPDGSEHRFAGQSYSILSYNGVNFTTRNQKFVDDLQSGNIARLGLKTFDETLEDGTKIARVKLSSFTTQDAMDRFEDVQVRRAKNARTIRLLDETPVTPAELKAFQFAE